MDVYIEKSDEHIVHQGPIEGRLLLEKLNINSNSIILVRNDEVILEDEIIEDDDEIRILSVISGG